MRKINTEKRKQREGGKGFSVATLDGYILLHAINPSQNVWRFYEMRFQRDLFGGYTTTICFGRISSPSGTKKELVFSSTEEQLIHAKNILKKRLSAKQRRQI
jgi:predicted DNA-binding WGR domain protein